MPNTPAEPPWLRQMGPDLLSQASSVLAREAARAWAAQSWVAPSGTMGKDRSGATQVAREEAGLRAMSGGARPVTGATVLPDEPDRLRQRAHECVAALLGTFSEADRHDGARLPQGVLASAAGGNGPEIQSLVDRKCPITGAVLPLAPPGMDHVRRQAHELIEALLAASSGTGAEKAGAYEDQVPLIRCVAPVQAGDDARATMRVANDEASASEVALYCTNFVADSGYEIPSLRVTVSPRAATVPAKGEAAFEIKVAVSQQAPAGIYSGLIQASGTKYVKAVLLVEVL